MSAVVKLELGCCADCDRDCIICINNGYCYYEKQQEEKENQIKDKED